MTDPPKSWNLNKVDWLGVSDTLTVDHAAKYDARIFLLPLCMWLDSPEASCSGQNSDWIAMGKRFPPSCGDWTLLVVGYITLVKEAFSHIFNLFLRDVSSCWHDIYKTQALFISNTMRTCGSKIRGPCKTSSKMASLVHSWSFTTKVIPKSYIVHQKEAFWKVFLKHHFSALSRCWNFPDVYCP